MKIHNILTKRSKNRSNLDAAENSTENEKKLCEREAERMYIDPGNKGFITLFVVVILGTIAFFATTIFVDFRGDVNVRTINFENSNFRIDIKQQKSDKNYVIKVFKDNKWLQDVLIGNDFGEREFKVTKLEDGGFKIGTGRSQEISFHVDVDRDDFSSIYVKRKLTKNDVVMDCVPFESFNWYGGPEQMDQRYPVQKFEFSDYAYITKELHSAAIMERYWFSTSTFFILIDYDAPLFIDQDSEKICFTAKSKLPFDTHSNFFNFNYKIGGGKSIKDMHVNVINHYLGKPRGLPDTRLIKYPIWNTWVNFGRQIDENSVEEYAQKVLDHEFGHSLLDIDDFWEDCYGSLVVNTTNFGNLKSLTAKLKSEGFIVGMWVHPFINKNCEPYYSFAMANDFLVKSYSGETDTSWWNSGTNQAAHVDFANPAALSWFRRRLEAIQRDFGVDIFKFDAGETSWYPQDPKFERDQDITPSQITRAFVRMAADFGDKLEIRTGWGTQDLHVLVRMLDFDSRWGVNNGLKSLIPTLLQFNFNGYVFVLPDMIGGNQYGADRITKELFIRWLEASVFMPSLQFSWAPWNFDEETINITRKFVQLHEKYSDYVLERMRLAISDGQPVNLPIWWLDESDAEAQTIDDEYLLGDKYLAAPVIEEGATSRRIYLPKGKWVDGNNNEMFEGPIWIDYPAPLGTLPYFIREDE